MKPKHDIDWDKWFKNRLADAKLPKDWGTLIDPDTGEKLPAPNLSPGNAGLMAKTTSFKWDNYSYTMPVSRWQLLKLLIMGKMKLIWLVSAGCKDKKLHLEGKKEK